MPWKLGFLKKMLFFFLTSQLGKVQSIPSGLEIETQVFGLWSLSLSYVSSQLGGSASLANVAQLC